MRRMAPAVRMSPAMAVPATARMVVQVSRVPVWIMLSGLALGFGFWLGVFGEGWAVGDETYAADDEQDASPAVDRDGFVEPELREQGDDDVAEGGGGEDEGEVGPAEGGEVAGEEAEEAEDAGDDPGVLHRGEEEAEVAEGDGADLRHAVGEEGVADRGGEHDG
jgi:hypothetical protein